MPVRPIPRLPALVGALALAVTVLAGCGDDDSSSPLADPTTSAASGSGSPETSPTQSQASDEDQLRTLVSAYDAALLTVRDQQASDDTALADVATPAWGATVIGGYRTNIYDQGDELVGRSTSTVKDVEVDGDTATVGACVDARELFVVAQGKPVQADDQPQGLRSTEFRAVRDGERWLVDGAETVEGLC